MVDERHRQHGPRNLLQGLTIGVLTGVLVMALIVPLTQDTVVLDDSSQRAGMPRSAGAEGGSIEPSAGSERTADDQGAQPEVGSPVGRARAGGGTGSDDTRAESATSVASSSDSSRDVGNDRIKIGIAVLDVGALRNLGPAYDSGEPRKQWRALVDGWRRNGLLPVHGRDIELVFHEYSPLNDAEQRSACVALVQDAKVFAVVGIIRFQLGSECVAREFRTPLLTSDGPNEQVLQRSHPFLFSLGMSESKLVRNWMHWAHHNDHLLDKTIGLYYENEPTQTHIAQQVLEPELQRLGYSVAVEATTDSATGGPQDAVAVQRFRSEMVDLAVLLTSKQGFMQQAEAQRYEPTYIESAYVLGTSDTATANYPPEQFDGTFGMEERRAGEAAAGMSPPPRTQECIDNYERYTGEEVPVPGPDDQDNAEYGFILLSCDLGEVLIDALHDAGRELTSRSFISGVESIRQQPLRRYGSVTFLPDRHHGSDRVRTVRWDAGCECWKAASDFGSTWTE